MGLSPFPQVSTIMKGLVGMVHIVAAVFFVCLDLVELAT
jgi:hypothetical protein